MAHSALNIRFICGVLTAVAVLCFISPQFIYAHGLRSVFPLMALTVSLAVFSRKRVCTAALSRSWLILLCGGLFIAQALARFQGVSEPGMVASDLINVYVINASVSLLMVFWVFLINELGGPAVSIFRRIVLFGWGISLALGIPTLLSHPFVARLTMSTPDALDNAFIYAPHGVGNYLNYTPFAILLLPMLLFATRLRGVERIAAAGVLVCGAVAVFLSTFTMAAALLAGSFALGLGAYAFLGGGNALIRIAGAAIVIAGIGYAGYACAEYFEQATFVVEKFERLMAGFAASGVAQGDETGRGAWFASEMNYFLGQNPFFGYVSGTTAYMAHGHSSLADTLVLFGAWGALWAVVLAGMAHQAWRSAGSAVDRYAIAGAYAMLAASGILNPTWYFPQFIVPLAVFTLGMRSALGEPVRRRIPEPLVEMG